MAIAFHPGAEVSLFFSCRYETAWSKTEKNGKTLMCRFTRVLLKRRNYFASKVEIYNTCLMFLKGIMKGLARVLLLVLTGVF